MRMEPRAARGQVFRSFLLLAGAALVAFSFAARPRHVKAQERPPAPSPEEIGAPAAGAHGPVEGAQAGPGEIERATIGIHISDMRNVEVREGKFEATFYYWLRHAKKADPKE